MDKYSCYSELAASEKEGNDYSLIASPRESASVAIIAPHAGGIEARTGGIARNIAGTEFSLYCFCGLKRNGNSDLHITSHKFDEPMCLEMVAKHRWVVAIHGCGRRGERVFLGGLDKSLINDLVLALSDVGILAETCGHEFTAKHPKNICNLGITRAGVQFELSLPFRKSSRVPAFVATVREVLLKRQNGT
jgi:phage replication-related protein YjqB (UPF0714/DUF867 family)